MKKSLGILFLALMWFLPAGIAAQFDCTGVWTLNALEVGGLTLDASVVGMEMTLALNADGSAVLQSPGAQASTGSWSMLGSQLIIAAGAEALPATLDGDRLYIRADENGTRMVFGRQRVNSAFQPAAARTDVTLSDFNGSWRADSMGILGMRYAADQPMTLEIDEGRVRLRLSGGSGEASDYEVQAALEGNVLRVPAPQDVAGAQELWLQLLEDGTLAHSEESGGMILEIYFIRSDAS